MRRYWHFEYVLLSHIVKKISQNLISQKPLRIFYIFYQSKLQRQKSYYYVISFSTNNHIPFYSVIKSYYYVISFGTNNHIPFYSVIINNVQMQNRNVCSSQSQVHHTFGKPNLPRRMEPSMYDIFTWGAQRTPPKAEDHLSTDHQRNQQRKKNQQRQQGKIEIEEEQLDKSRYEDDLPGVRMIKPEKLKQRNKNHVSKSNLYTYENVSLRRAQSQKIIQNQAHTPAPFIKTSIAKTKLDPEKDKHIIQERQTRIKEFKKISRDLPNSSSVTYFGKPVFQCFGRGSANLPNKSYNIMPHTGQNQPKTQQSYVSALIKAAHHKPQSRIPRKPLLIQDHKKQQKQQKQQSQINTCTNITNINIPLETPDLINNVRFSNEVVIKQKVGVPRFSETMPKSKIKKGKEGKKKTKKTKNILKESDGLKFMNQRQNLLQILQNKKLNKTKLALKITQCCPGTWVNSERRPKTGPFIEEWEKIRPAGKQYPPNQIMKELMEFVP